MVKEFQAPIPGQSLTTEPRGQAYERPPEITDPEEAIQMHLARLSREEMLENVVDGLEMGIEIDVMTKGIVRNAVASGVHSIDVGLIVAPVIHEFIKTTGDRAGVEYEEGLTDEEAEEQRRKAIKAAKTVHKFKKKQKKGKTAKKAPKQEETVPMDNQGSESPAGFMRRRGT